MSTKIYDGVIIKDVDSSRRLLEFRQSARETLLPVLRNEYKKLFYRCIILMGIYEKTGHMPIGVKFPFKEYRGSGMRNLSIFIDTELYNLVWQNSHAHTAYEWSPPLDLEAEVAFFPIQNKTLAIPFINNRALMKAFKSLPQVVPYGFWDNVDKDEDVSDEEWEIRRKEWDEALLGLGVPRECGLCVELVGYNDAQCNYYDFSDIDTAAIFESATKSYGERVLYDKIKKAEFSDREGDTDLVFEINKRVRADAEGVRAEQLKIQEILKPYLEQFTREFKI